MAEPTIICPSCGKKIPLTKALTEQLEEKLRVTYEAEAERREKEAQEQYEKQLAEAQRKAEKKAREAVTAELDELRETAAKKDKELEASRKQELKLLRRQRELEDREKTLELDVARRIAEEKQQIEEAAAARLAEEHRVKDLEKEKQLADMRKQIEDLKRRAEQGSQQTQGEAVELQLEQALRMEFCQDQIRPVPKGLRGADITQLVCDETGRPCGTIVWESKNTKAWNDEWLAKLKDDQIAIRAEIAVLATTTLPKGVTRFTNIGGIWITDFPSAIGLAAVLHAQLVEIAKVQRAAEGQHEKAEMLYGYLAGNEFRQKVEAIVESFLGMRDDLNRERAAIERLWAKREKQITRVVHNMAGMYGDMQGIIGAALPGIAHLELPAPDETPRETADAES